MRYEEYSEELIKYVVGRFNANKARFLGDSWFEILGGVKVIKNLIDGLTSMMIKDRIISHLFESKDMI